jgi:protein involved in polysaccharide export with SLBB domain
MFRQLQVWVALLLIAVVIPARAGQAANKERPAAQSASADPGAATQKVATQDPNYIIGPQDVLDISVWKEPEVSRVVPVRPDGRISLPLLNDVQAAGMTPSQLAAQITTSLKKFVTESASDRDCHDDKQPTRLYSRRSDTPWRFSHVARNERATGAFQRGRIHTIRED